MSHTLEDILTEISTQAVLDLDRIFLLDNRQTGDAVHRKLEEWRQTVLADWWGAKCYVLGPGFEDDCRRAEIDYEAAMSRLKPKIVRGREVYGRWVRQVQSVNLPVDEEETANG